MRLYKSYHFLLVLINIYILGAQTIPNEFFDAKFRTYLLDIGEGWDKNSNLGSLRFQDLKSFKLYSEKYPDSLYVDLRGGVFLLSKSIAFYNFSHFLYKKNLYGYLYPRIVNNKEYIARYSGIPRAISRAGFNSGETDLSGIGFQNNWLRFQIGRGSENWSSGDGIGILISDYAPSFDYFLLGSDYGNLRVRYFHGFLESDLNKINRYISGRGIEYSNQKSMLISISETVIYSGKNKPLDFAYMNPISSHLEIELNNRLNNSEEGGANAVWQFSSDLMYKNFLRFSFNYIIDEFVLDAIQKDEGKQNGVAFSMKTVISPLKLKQNIISAYISFIKVGTPTFRHGIGSNNFVQRSIPLGWRYGSDGTELKLGLKYFNRKKLLIDVYIKEVEYGSESIIVRPYEKYKDYLSGPFPSGELSKIFIVSNEIEFKLREEFRISSIIDIDEKFNIKVKFGLNFFISNNFYL